MDSSFNIVRPEENPTFEEVTRLEGYKKGFTDAYDAYKEENQAKLLLLEQELREDTPQADKDV